MMQNSLQIRNKRRNSPKKLTPTINGVLMTMQNEKVILILKGKTVSMLKIIFICIHVTFMLI